MKVCVVTPWYPDRVHPFAGNFVRQQVDALRAHGVHVEVEVALRHPAPRGLSLTAARRAIDLLAARDHEAVYGDAEALSYIPTLDPPAIGFAGRATEFRRALEAKRRYRPIDADVVHAHVALPAGHAALSVDDRPVVVTEHFTGLSRVLAQSDALEMYVAVIERARKFATVSESLRRVIVEHLGAEFSECVSITPNIVDLTGIPVRVPSPTRRSNSWLYVGTLTELKGIELLLRSFVKYRSTVPDATLTIVGDGPMRDWVNQFRERQSVTDAVRLVGSVDHSHLAEYFLGADLLVHLSRVETFGISTMEAIGAGLPVINLDNGAAREVWGEIEPMVGVILNEEADEEEVCAAAVRLSRSNDLDPSAGRQFVVERYSPHTVAQHLVEQYRSIL